jgi:hypothetical protein
MVDLFGGYTFNIALSRRSVRDDFGCPGRLSAKNALATDQTE